MKYTQTKLGFGSKFLKNKRVDPSSKKRKLKQQTHSESVKQFLEQDINSTTAPGKNETITRNKIKKTKRCLTDSLRNLHKK